MDKKDKRFLKLAAAVLSVSVFSSSFSSPAAAVTAEVFKPQADLSAAQEEIRIQPPEQVQEGEEKQKNKAAVDEALSAVRKALASGTPEDTEHARILVEGLTPTNKVRMYVEMNRDRYLQLLLADSRTYFDAEQYLERNPDVRAAALHAGAGNEYRFALRHYLTYGIFEARSSETAFDPVRAAIAYPELLNSLLFSGDASPDRLRAAFTERTSLAATEAIRLSWTAPLDGEGNLSREPLTYTLYLLSDGDRTTASGKAQDGQRAQQSSDDSDHNSPGTAPAPEPAPGPDTRKRDPAFLNRGAKLITPYILYTEPGNGSSSFRFTTGNAFTPKKNTGQIVEGIFYGDNYRKAKELSAGKDYTLLVYMCGTDQEIDKEYRRVSLQLVSMMQADVSNVNVLLCVGGTNSYASDYMDKGTADGSAAAVSGLRSGIYYVNPGGLPDKVKDVLKAPLFSGEISTVDQIMRDLDDPSKKYNGITYNDVITEETFIQLSSTGPVDMGDGALLSGFLNFGTSLFPAKTYGLSLSDHGGGVERGTISSDDLKENDAVKIEGTTITTDELESALASSDLFRNKNISEDGKLGLLFFDACLMGSTEEAWNLKDYYRWMLGSEEQTMSWTDYGTFISRLSGDVGAGKADKEIAEDLAKDFSSTLWHRGQDRGAIGSVAVFSSAAMDETIQKLNSLSGSLETALKGSGGVSKETVQDIFIALRTSALSCYNAASNDTRPTLGDVIENRKYVDIGEFLIFLSENLDGLIKKGTSGKSAGDMETLRTLKEKTDDALNAGFLSWLSIQNYSGFRGYIWGDADGTVKMGDVTETGFPTWMDLRGKKSTLYGSSLYFPFGGSAEEFVKSEYYKYYSGSELDSYVRFLKTYLDYYNDKEGYASKRAELAKELEGKGLYCRLITPSENMIQVGEGDDSRSFIKFQIAASYEDAGINSNEIPAHSTGNPMLDILETQSTIQVAAVHQEYFGTAGKTKGADGQDEAYLKVHMICAEENVSEYSYALTNNSIYFNVTDLKHSVIDGFTLQGNLYDVNTGAALTEEKNVNGKVTAETVTDWQFVLRSDLEYDEKAKADVIKTLGGQADDEGTYKQYFTVLGGTITGKDTVSDNSYHVFRKDNAESSNDFRYMGSVDLKTAQKMGGVSAISVYHYILKEETDREGNITGYSKKMLEDFAGIGDGFFAADTDQAGKSNLVISSQGITEQVDGAYTNERTGYALQIGTDNKNYSMTAKLSKEEYDKGGNVGNGPLAVINRDAENLDPYIRDHIEFYEEEKKEDDYSAADPEEELPDHRNVPETGDGAVMAAETGEITEQSDAPGTPEETEEAGEAEEPEAAEKTEAAEEPEAAEGTEDPGMAELAEDAGRAEVTVETGGTADTGATVAESAGDEEDPAGGSEISDETEEAESADQAAEEQVETEVSQEVSGDITV